VVVGVVVPAGAAPAEVRAVAAEGASPVHLQVEQVERPATTPTPTTHPTLSAHPTITKPKPPAAPRPTASATPSATAPTRPPPTVAQTPVPSETPPPAPPQSTPPPPPVTVVEAPVPPPAKPAVKPAAPPPARPVPPPAPKPVLIVPSVISQPGIAGAVLSLLNQERAQNSLGPLHSNGSLQGSAYNHNLAMVRTNDFAHQVAGEGGLASRIPEFGWAGENIAWSSVTSNSAALSLEAQMYNETPPDDGHRLNILNTHYTSVGISVVTDRTGKMWITEDFGG
jgi:uncharacterized protein YkwD